MRLGPRLFPLAGALLLLFGTAPAGALPPAAPSAPERALESLVLARVELNDADLATALEALRQAAEAASQGRLRPNFFTPPFPPGFTPGHVTLRLESVPFNAALAYVGRAAGVEFRRERHAIVVLAPR